MAWVYLLLAGFLEIGWATGLKLTDDFKRPVATILTVLAMLASFWFLSKSVQSIALGTAYAVWTGIGVVGTATLGIVLFGESASALRVGCIGLIVAGILGLKLLHV